jgi:hypothetical protein
LQFLETGDVKFHRCCQRRVKTAGCAAVRPERSASQLKGIQRKDAKMQGLKFLNPLLAIESFLPTLFQPAISSFCVFAPLC